MPRVTRNSFPGLTRHASGQAKLRFRGRDHYLGTYGSRDAEANYLKAKAAFLLTGELPDTLTRPSRRSEKPGPPSEASVPLTVAELADRFLNHARTQYVRPDRKPNAEYHCYCSALRMLIRVHGSTAVDAFGSRALQEVRAVMVGGESEAGDRWTRGFINRSVSRIKRVFKWGVSLQLVRPDTAMALASVDGLRTGKSAAKENPKRGVVSADQIKPVKEVVSERYADMIDLMLRTAARPGELVSLTTRMVDRSGPVWTAEITDHKTAMHGHRRFLIFDAEAQTVLAKYMSDAKPDTRLFPLRRDAFGRAVKSACDELKIVPAWTPHWLRHTALTRIRCEGGAEVAQQFAGHSRLAMTEHYARPDLRGAIEYAMTTSG